MWPASCARLRTACRKHARSTHASCMSTCGTHVTHAITHFTHHHACVTRMLCIRMSQHRMSVTTHHAMITHVLHACHAYMCYTHAMHTITNAYINTCTHACPSHALSTVHEHISRVCMRIRTSQHRMKHDVTRHHAITHVLRACQACHHACSARAHA